MDVLKIRDVVLGVMLMFMIDSIMVVVGVSILYL